MNESQFRELVSDATEDLRARIARARDEFGIGDFERYDQDLSMNRFWWSDAGMPQVEARIVIVGSISTASNTWLWSWAKNSRADNGQKGTRYAHNDGPLSDGRIKSKWIREIQIQSGDDSPVGAASFVNHLIRLSRQPLRFHGVHIVTGDRHDRC